MAKHVKVFLIVLGAVVYNFGAMVLVITCGGTWIAHARDAYWWEYLAAAGQFLIGASMFIIEVMWLYSKEAPQAQDQPKEGK
jgi:hypothetical protein